MPKYLLISGSPRKGNTDFILSKIFENLHGEKELIFLRDLNINQCRGCLGCYKSGHCLQSDDMSALFQKIILSDLLIMGSPLYYGNVSGLIKKFIDRTLPAYKSALLKNKKIISIMVGGGDEAVTEKFHKEAIKGFIKYNKLNLIATYNFKAYEASDLKEDPKAVLEINKIIEKIVNHSQN